MTTDFSSDHHHPASRSTAAEINPYAPSLVHADSAAKNLPVRGFGHVSTVLLIVNTMAGITFSGGIFGIGMLVFDDSPPVILISGAILGCFLAFLGSLAIVPLTAVGTLLFRVPGVPWTATGIRIFGATSGFLTGFLWLPILAGFTAWSLALGLIPGTVGAIGTAVTLIPLARRARRAWEQFADESLVRAGERARTLQHP